MAPISTNSSAWKKYVDQQNGGAGKYNQGGWFELEYNGHILKYLVACFGTQPSTGYPLYIGLHGGGGESEKWKMKDNDNSWRGLFDGFYRDPIKNIATQAGGSGAVYIAARGISALYDDDPARPHDTYDLHSQPESFLLMQRMIANLLLPQPNETKQGTNMSEAKLNGNTQHFVDPDRVYLLGFSAGGDGVYQLISKIPDRFASAVAGGGHPNQATFANIANLPVCLQTGERDQVSGGGLTWLRSRSTIECASRIRLPDGQTIGNYFRINSDDALPLEWYQYEVHIIKDGDHNQWAFPDQINRPQKILTNLAAWYADSEKPYKSMNPGARDYTMKNINAVAWATQFTRNSLPNKLVWDLSSRPPHYPKLSQPEHLQPERLFYWLYIRDPAAPDFNTKDVIFADYGWNFVRINKPSQYIAILINENMIPFDRTYDVIIDDPKVEQGWTSLRKVEAGTITPSEGIGLETLAIKGDPNHMFSAMIYFVPSGNGGWEAKITTDTINLPAPK